VSTLNDADTPQALLSEGKGRLVLGIVKKRRNFFSGKRLRGRT